MHKQNISIITTCKGRLSHLQQTLPTFAQSSAQELIVVDYDCPLGTEEWVAKNWPSVRVVKVDNRPHFNCSEARNLGAEKATAEYLFFIDADIFLETPYISELDQIDGRCFLKNKKISDRDRSVRQVNGTCLVKRRDFLAVGGYDVNYQLYGLEDGDLYARLNMTGVVEKYFGDTKFRTLHHDDSLRTMFRKDVEIKRAIQINTIYREIKFFFLKRNVILSNSDVECIFSELVKHEALPVPLLEIPLGNGRHVCVSRRRAYYLFGNKKYYVTARADSA